MARDMIRVVAYQECVSVRRLRLTRKPVEERMTPREAAMAYRLTKQIEKNTELKEDIFRLKRLYSEARAGLRRATGCEAPSPNVRMEDREVGERRASDAPLPIDTHEFNGTAEQRPVPSPPPPPPPRRSSNGGLIRNMEVMERLADISPSYVTIFARERRAERQRIGLMIVCLISLFISVMLFFHPIILTWLLNWKIE